MTTSAASRPLPRSERARRAVLDATLALVTEVPYATLTIEAIAARAGASKATVYRHWRSKGALVVDALADANARDPESTYGLPDTGDLRADLATVLRATVDELNDPVLGALLRALSVETLLDEGLRNQVVERIFTPQLRAFETRFATSDAAGATDPLVALEVVVAPLFHRWQQGTAPLTHAYADEVARLAVRALTGRE
ncbi:TetR/AcrR family transcriptional regulator [Nocardioides marmoraquaticus]